jgi:hypothetical protein
MNLDRNSLKRLVQEEVAGLLEAEVPEMPSYAETRAQPEHVPARNVNPPESDYEKLRKQVGAPEGWKVPDSLKHLLEPGAPSFTSGRATVTHEPQQRYANIPGYFGPGEGWPSTAPKSERYPVSNLRKDQYDQVIDPKTGSVDYVKKESKMKLSRNNLKRLVQEEIVGLLEADPLAALRASLASEEEPKGRGHYLPKEEPESEPEPEEGASKRPRLVRDLGPESEPSERELRRAMAANKERLDVPEGKLHRESKMKLTRNDLKQLVQEETGVLLEAPPIDTSQVQQSSKVTQVLRIIDGMKPEDVQSLIQALQQLGLVPPPV